MSTKCCTCPCFGASQEAMISPAPAPEMLRECSGNAPGDAPGSLARVSNVYCLMFREPLVFGEACSRPPRPEVGGIVASDNKVVIRQRNVPNLQF